jgi:hypothetical protein
MKIYLIGGKQYAVVGEELFEKVAEFSPLEAIVDNTTVEAKVSRIVKGNYTSRKPNKAPKKKGAKRGGHRMMHCKVCDGYGHMAKTCPERKPEAEKIKAGQEEGLIETADPRSQVQEMKAQGKTSVDIARELGMSLAQVNKYW